MKDLAAQRAVGSRFTIDAEVGKRNLGATLRYWRLCVKSLFAAQTLFSRKVAPSQRHFFSSIKFESRPAVVKNPQGEAERRFSSQIFCSFL
jgi:hypothetical protein